MKRKEKKQWRKALFLTIPIALILILLLFVIQLFTGDIGWFLRENWHHTVSGNTHIKSEGTLVSRRFGGMPRDEVILLDNDVFYFGTRLSRSAVPIGHGPIDRIKDVTNTLAASGLDGKTIWESELPQNQGVCAKPELVGSTLLFPVVRDELIDVGRIQSVQSSLFAVNKETGEIVWSAESAGSRECPKVSHDESSLYWVFFDRNDANQEYPVSNNKSWNSIPVTATLHSVEAQTGDKMWTRSVANNTCEEMLVTDQFLISLTDDGKVIAYQKSSGDIVWQSDTQLVGCGQLEMQGDVVLEVVRQDTDYSANKVSVSRLDMTNGDLLLTREFDGDSGTYKYTYLPVVDGNTVLLTVNDGHPNEGKRKDWVESYDLSTGDLQWQFAPYDKLLIRGNPFIHGDKVYVALQYKQELYALDRKTGDVIRKVHLMSGNGSHQFSFNDGKLYLTNAYIDVFDAETLDRVFWSEGKHTLYHFDKPVFEGDEVFVTDGHGYFYKF
jgi:outer membrane protein assembly factor BamB